MGFAIPPLTDLVKRARASFRASLPGSDAWLWPNNIGPAAKVIAGMTHELFGFADYTARQKFAATADGENLDRHGYEYGVARRPASSASGRILISAPDGGITVATGAMFSRGDSVEFVAVAPAVSATSGDLEVEVAATVDGRIGLTVAGAPMSIGAGVSGPGASTASAAAGWGGLTGGTDVESDEAYRARILFRKRNPPHGGSAADYVMWASEVPGVTRVFVERLFAGPGSVRIFVMMDGLYATGVPLPSDIERVQAHIDNFKPAAALAAVFAPEPVAIDVQISGLTPFNADVQSEIKAEIADVILRQGRVAGSDTPNPSVPFLATPFSFSRSWLWQAVANAAGEERHTILAPTSDVVLSVGEVPVLGSINYL